MPLKAFPQISHSTQDGSQVSLCCAQQSPLYLGLLLLQNHTKTTRKINKMKTVNNFKTCRCVKEISRQDIHIQRLRHIQDYVCFLGEIGLQQLFYDQDKSQREDWGADLAGICSLLLPLQTKHFPEKCSKLIGICTVIGLFLLDQ